MDVGYDKHFRVNHGKNEFALEGEIRINGTDLIVPAVNTDGGEEEMEEVGIDHRDAQ